MFFVEILFSNLDDDDKVTFSKYLTVENEILVDAITLIYKEGITQNESFQYLSKKLDEEGESADPQKMLFIVQDFVTKLGDIAKAHINFACPLYSDGDYVLDGNIIVYQKKTKQ